MVRTNPDAYLRGDYQGDKAPAQCAGIFHKKFKNKTDERLTGSDGVLFDTESAHFTEVDGWAIGQKKLHMDGWAIQFVGPKPDEIKARLNTHSFSSIDSLQFRAAAYWVEKNRTSRRWCTISIL